MQSSTQVPRSELRTALCYITFSQSCTSTYVSLVLIIPLRFHLIRCLHCHHPSCLHSVILSWNTEHFILHSLRLCLRIKVYKYILPTDLFHHRLPYRGGAGDQNVGLLTARLKGPRAGGGSSWRRGSEFRLTSYGIEFGAYTDKLSLQSVHCY